MPDHVYEAIKRKEFVTWTQSAITDVFLKKRHAIVLLLKTVKCLVSQEESDPAITGRPILESAGCDNKTLFAAGCDKSWGITNVSGIVIRHETEAKTGSILALLDDGGYDNATEFKVDVMGDYDVYIDLREDP